MKRKIVITFILGLGLTLALVGLLESSSVTAAPAVVFTVTKLIDTADGTCDDDCSLREAIIAANNNPGADVISLTVAGTYELTITGTSEGQAATGDLDIRDDLTIVGQGPGATIIDANGIDRVLNTNNAGTVVISGVTIMGGAPPSGGGGGIYNSDTDLSLTHVAVVSNSAVLWGGAGGGIRLEGSNAALTMDENSILARNEAYGGGGLAVVDDAQVTLSAGRIVSNTVDTSGGGVTVIGASFTQTGAITISHNVASSQGGGVYVYSGSSAVLNGGLIISNTATNGAGVYVASGSARLNGGQIVGNAATDNGGGVYVHWSTATFTQSGDSTVARNTAVLGGGVYVYIGQATLSGGRIISNTAREYGGGLYIDSSSAILSGGQILSNTAGDRGGGVYLNTSNAAFTQTSGLIAYNVVTDTDLEDGGGGIFVSSGQVTLAGGQVLGNQASRGGGVHIRLGQVTMQEGQIIGNEARYGGGVYTGLVGWSAVIEGGQIISNTAKNGGGGLFVETGSTTVQNGLISGNQADDGGGVYSNGGMMTLINTTVSGNHADSSGGGVYNGGGTISLTHATVASNTSAGGYGIHLSAGSTLARNAIIAYNSIQNCNGTLGSHGHNLDSDGTCNLGASGDLVTDPQLAPLAYDRGTLVHAIGSGSPAHQAASCVTGIYKDQRGLVRFPPCDIGAYEYESVREETFLPLTLRNY